ncbi:hypothetical protein [Rhodospirillum centenum]|uniref:Uncharacterized protein n=1 Tax=Rhodospirillum centenum (strain ATCC 51521 / SW) TaxID=414684 RepID=B6IPY6_RHOCS|nr:hypothetical protein [Rhodospirillum centenum]ACI97522.1 hypothetical protein RC1_0073 [Rhodospirillum centenum SW]
MQKSPKLNVRRYLPSKDFVSNLREIRAFRGAYYGNNLLESLEMAGLLRPKLRLRWPDPVARRMWLEGHSDVGSMQEAVEPDGPRWGAAVRLENSLFRTTHPGVYGDIPHPFDEPDPAFVEFLQRPAQQVYQSHQDRRVSVANEKYPELFADCNVRDFYSGWQVLVAAEFADIGIHFRLNMADAEAARRARHAVFDGRRPADTWREITAPTRALNGFQSHEAALDAVVWSEEEADHALGRILRDHGGGRFWLTEDQAKAYHQAQIEAARKAQEHYGVQSPAILELCKFLAERWSDWEFEGRTLIAHAYKVYLAAAIRMLRMAAGMAFDDIKESVGCQSGHREFTLDAVWPDWVRDQKDRLIRTLQPAVQRECPGAMTDDEIIAFADFIDQERQDAVFLRLESFERHAFGDVDARLAGMSSDLQGLTVAVEHVARAMGGSGDHLHEMFRNLWTGTEIEKLLKRNQNDVRRSIFSPSMNIEEKAEAYSSFKVMIEGWRSSCVAKAIAADLVTASKLRGAVHYAFPERDHLEMEKLFVAVLRAAALTHAHVRRSQQIKISGQAGLLPTEPASKEC